MGCGASKEQIAGNDQEHKAGDPTLKKNKKDHKSKDQKSGKRRDSISSCSSCDSSDSSDDEGHGAEKKPKEKKVKKNESTKTKTPKEKPVVVFVLGGPGSGKGTQCDRIVKEYGFKHFSVGDLLRAEKESGSQTAKLIDEYIAEGKLVPARIPVRLIKKAMRKAGWTKNYYLVDGFPRNQENLDAWQQIFKDSVDVKFILYYDCSFETMEKRIMERSKTSGRSDDNADAIKKRFQTYQNETKPVIDFFEAKNEIRKINAERDVNAVYADTQAALNTIKDSIKPRDQKPSAVFVLGGPGSGKGTQCEKIIQDFGFKHLSVGDLLRAEKSSGSELAKEIESYISQGKLVPSEVPVKLLKQAIDSAPKGTDFLIDGFPRNKENIDVWNRIIGDSVEVKKILYFECSFETMEKRIMERSKTSGRSDDNIDALKKRFETYQNETAPVIEEYKKQKMIKKINAEQEVGKVYSITRKTLKKLYN